MKPSADAQPLSFRQPSWFFAFLAALICYATTLLLAAWAGSGFSRIDAMSLRALAAPAAIGLALNALAVRRRLKRGASISLHQAALLSAAAFGAIGFAWPFSFGVAVLLQGDAHAAVAYLAPSFMGAAVGAGAGALAGLLTAVTCAQRA